MFKKFCNMNIFNMLLSFYRCSPCKEVRIRIKVTKMCIFHAYRNLLHQNKTTIFLLKHFLLQLIQMHWFSSLKMFNGFILGHAISQLAFIMLFNIYCLIIVFLINVRQMSINRLSTIIQWRGSHNYPKCS